MEDHDQLWPVRCFVALSTASGTTMKAAECQAHAIFQASDPLTGLSTIMLREPYSDCPLEVEFLSLTTERGSNTEKSLLEAFSGILSRITPVLIIGYSPEHRFLSTFVSRTMATRANAPLPGRLLGSGRSRSPDAQYECMRDIFVAGSATPPISTLCQALNIPARVVDDHLRELQREIEVVSLMALYARYRQSIGGSAIAGLWPAVLDAVSRSGIAPAVRDQVSDYIARLIAHDP